MIRSLRPVFWLLCLWVMPACTSVSTSSESTAPPRAVAAEPSVAQPTGAIAPPPSSQIRTEPLSPAPIRIELGTLPAPYATSSASKSPQVIDIPANPTLKVPAGFTVNVFADGLDAPRWLALTPTGDVLVTETRQNRIRLLGDRNQDGVAEVNQTFATASNGLNIPFGMAFAGDAFFLGNSASVLRFPYASGQIALTGQGQTIADLPGSGYNQQWTRNVVAAPDGTSLYVSIGSRSNADEEPLPRASVQVMNLDGSNQKTFASGLRNPVGLDFHPVTRTSEKPLASDMGRDRSGC